MPSIPDFSAIMSISNDPYLSQEINCPLLFIAVMLTSPVSHLQHLLLGLSSV